MHSSLLTAANLTVMVKEIPLVKKIIADFRAGMFRLIATQYKLQ